MASDPHVVIALPTTGIVSSTVAVGWAFMFGKMLGVGVRTEIMCSNLGDVATARRELVKLALDTEATHVFWLDADILPEPDAALRLLEDDERVIGGLYRKRGFPYEPVVCSFDEEADMFKSFSAFDPEGVTEVGGMGHGCLLVETSVYREMAAYFEDDRWYVFDPDLGEDLYFCKRLRALGVSVWLDARVRCSHEMTTVIPAMLDQSAAPSPVAHAVA